MTFKVPEGHICQNAQSFLTKHPELAVWLGGVKTVVVPSQEKARLISSDGNVIAVGCNQCFKFLRSKLKELESFEQQRAKVLARSETNKG